MQISLHATEEKIIQAYLRVCYRQGFEKITLEKLAKESKVSLASVRYHFSDPSNTLEDATLMYVLVRGYSYIQKFMELEKKRPGYRALYTYINANFAWAQAHLEESRFILYYFYLLGTPNRNRIAKLPYLQKARERIEEMFYIDVGRGLLKPVDNVKDFIVDLHNMLAGSMIISFIENTKGAHDKHRKRVLATLPYGA